MLTYIERTTGQEEEELVYGEKILNFLYKSSSVNHFFGKWIQQLVAKNSLCSTLYGFWQKQSFTKANIKPFVQKFNVNEAEFLDSLEQFQSFNDFFIRKLKPEARPIAAQKAIIPADGRYRFIPHIDQSLGFIVKGEKFSLEALLLDQELAALYEKGTMVMARLCPSDYHRFHFLCDCIPQETKLINGWLYSVNPMAVQQNIKIFCQNKRTYCILDSYSFGKVLFMEIGATNVGSIHQTYKANVPQIKGAEKGFFSFGGSALIILFQPNAITLCEDLLALSKSDKEIRCLFGQPLGS